MFLQQFLVFSFFRGPTHHYCSILLQSPGDNLKFNNIINRTHLVSF